MRRKNRLEIWRSTETGKGQRKRITEKKMRG